MGAIFGDLPIDSGLYLYSNQDYVRVMWQYATEYAAMVNRELDQSTAVFVQGDVTEPFAAGHDQAALLSWEPRGVLKVAAVLAGLALAPVLSKKPAAQVPAAVGAALSVALAESKGKSISVLLAYCDRLQRLTHWYVQLWAESLGKNGKGTTPLAALGPVDQHSQLQLFIAGPRDKLFSVVTVGAAAQGPRIDGELAKLAGEPGFSGKTIGDLVAAEGRATAETLAKNGCPVRTIHIDRLDEESLGELMMHLMLETIIAAHLLGIDAFDQPAVEEGKVLAKKYLAGS